MKMYQILDLAKLCDSIREIKMPLRTTYKFNKVTESIEKDLNFYQKKFNEIVEEYAKKDEAGKYIYLEDNASVAIIEGKEEECNNKLVELRLLDVETPNVTFSIDELDSIELNMNEMNCLMPLIKE